MTAPASVSLGSDRLVASDRLGGQRVGIVCNPASVDAAFCHVIDRVVAVPGATLAALFGPQHGFHSVAQDNMIETLHARHPRYGVPVYSLYSDTREPTAEMLSDLDLLVIDLQDVGTRVYTYVYTMANCLRAARRHGVPVVVCDRPNPIGGVAVEGPVLTPPLASFVGQFPIPLRHGMTIAELAQLFNQHFGLGADLEIIPMTGWTRSMYYEDTGLPWIMPSPNLPTTEGAVVYPGGVLFEGTNVSEGRGTTRPFELLGAPWVEADALVETLNSLTLPGVVFRPVEFEPTFQKHAGQVCGGCQLHVTDRTQFEPVQAAVTLMQAIRQQNSGAFEWRQPPYEYETVMLPIDILAGTARLREQIDHDVVGRDIASTWTSEVVEFDTTRRRFLLYE